ncbi:DNA topoisomerase I, partial [bacterium]|nr:DNA topoisomerase I [candidate division CSSED10-310 bacterium]
MAKSLVIVESPAKAKTINKFLGSDYEVKATVGHIKDLPKQRLGIDVSNNFLPDYITIIGKRKILNDLRKAAKRSSRILLAADPDREGEAICWHLANELHGINGQIERITFNEITSSAVRNSLESTHPIDQNRVDAQQARRVLDRLVGYKISPLLWRKVKRGLSAGRVQSVALRLVVDREREILAFQPQEYWLLHASLKGDSPPSFKARLMKLNGAKVNIPDRKTADEVLAGMRQAVYMVTGVDEKPQSRQPPPPFITSTLQQEA